MNAIQVLAGDAKQIPPDYNSAVGKYGETASQDASSHHHDCRNDADENVVMKLSSVFFILYQFSMVLIGSASDPVIPASLESEQDGQHFLSESDTTELFIGM